MKSFAGKITFPISWEEDLDSTITVFATIASMCQVSSEEHLEPSQSFYGGTLLFIVH